MSGVRKQALEMSGLLELSWCLDRKIVWKVITKTNINVRFS